MLIISLQAHQLVLAVASPFLKQLFQVQFLILDLNWPETLYIYVYSIHKKTIAKDTGK